MRGLLSARMQAGGMRKRRDSADSTTTCGSAHGEGFSRRHAEESRGAVGGDSDVWDEENDQRALKGADPALKQTGESICSTSAGRSGHAAIPSHSSGIKAVTPTSGRERVENADSEARTVPAQGGNRPRKKRQREFDWSETAPPGNHRYCIPTRMPRFFLSNFQWLEASLPVCWPFLHLCV